MAKSACRFYTIFVFVIIHCFHPVFAGDKSDPQIVPRPAAMKLLKGRFKLTNDTFIVIGSNNPELINLASLLKSTIREATNLNLQITSRSSNPKQIVLTSEGADPDVGKEGYDLLVTPQKVTIKSPAAHGIFYGIQTLKQLFPIEFFQKNSTRKERLPGEL